MKSKFNFFLVVSSVIILTSFDCYETTNKFTKRFLHWEELEPENSLTELNEKDLSEIWLATENTDVLGIYGESQSRVRLKFIAITKDTSEVQKYMVTGKYLLKDSIYSFTGFLNIVCYKKFRKMQSGVDNVHESLKMQQQGAIEGSYNFIVHDQSILKGAFYSKLCLDSIGIINYDNIQLPSDNFMNNSFIGKRYIGSEKIVMNWGDYRVPNCSDDLDMGAGMFSPSDSYVNSDSLYRHSWNNYRKAYFENNRAAQQIEMANWWK